MPSDIDSQECTVDPSEAARGLPPRTTAPELPELLVSITTSPYPNRVDVGFKVVQPSTGRCRDVTRPAQTGSREEAAVASVCLVIAGFILPIAASRIIVSVDDGEELLIEGGRVDDSRLRGLLELLSQEVAAGGHDVRVALHRSAWDWVGEREPPTVPMVPVLVTRTLMGRRELREFLGDSDERAIFDMGMSGELE